MNHSFPQYPVSLDLQDRPCLVVGGGAVATRKVAGLVSCGARVKVVAPDVRDEIRGMPMVEVHQRPYQRGEVTGYRLVMAATDDPEVNAGVYHDCESAGVWINAADEPASCSFTLPAVLRREAVTVAVSTGGSSPALAAWLRGRLAEWVGPEIGAAAALLAEARRELKAAGRSTERVDWQSVLDSDMLEQLKAGHVDRAKELMRRCLFS